MKLIYIAFFLIFFASPVFAYIDPGTGSMLFSLLTGVAVTAFFFFKNVLIKIKDGTLFERFLGKGKTIGSDKHHSLVIYSEGKQYWNVFRPILEELVKRKIPCAYCTSGEDDPGLLFSGPADMPGLIKKEFIGKGNTAYRFLNFLEADICLMTTPGLDVLQIKRSPGVKKYIHVLHMVTDPTTYRLFGLDYYDQILLTGEYQKKDIRELEEKRGTKQKELTVVGCTYLDVMSERLADLPPKDAAKTVLVAPSWGENGILKRYGLKLLEPLALSSYKIIIRPHPQSVISEKETLEKIQKDLARFENIEWNFDAENIKALSRADILISDFSGVIFDYAFLFNRPVVYPRFEFDKRPYDLSDIDDEAWTFRAIREIGLPVDETQFKDIEGILDRVMGEKKRGESTKRLKDEAWMYPGEAGMRIVDALGIHDV
ncbi:CDP-glycerol glycerophosphotransferase family protein [Leadbettera azotonutricia]|uniref:CDP-Glycerol:Poly(Glycerophosphate) glycerophosphotransferase family n=1 Tax=Leadbettera azotonutricia (strain ATCC BAA-888 / DSM 13862 / ZAS-9) TaxID=545695 RepID=F5YAU2_LEAAZ|nr:CDP-glycerol glycerophosphotransferase family protein [Leadbettera azotonutricia]AEF81291.1 CDP-Glycerol:Poly(glycerophosphate) glycerophosphotransferase family [Leadbettera azotonutricia ZAS-9]